MRRVLVTRPAEQAEEVCALLEEAGLEPVVVPLIRTDPVEDLSALDGPLGRVGEYRWVVFSSVTAARIMAERMAVLRIGAERWREVGIVAGPATARALAEHGLRASRVVAPFSARAALKALAGEVTAGTRVLLPRAEGGREELASGLRALGALVDEVVVYRTVPVSESPALVRELERGVDAVLFFSPSAVRGFKAAGGPLGDTLVACIGETTATEARRVGLAVDVVSPETTAAGLVGALAEHMTAHAVGGWR